MFVIVSFSKRHTQKENIEHVRINTVVLYDTVRVGALRDTIVIEIPIETIDTLHTNI